MEIFNIVNDVPCVTPEGLYLPELKKIWKRDKTKSKTDSTAVAVDEFGEPVVPDSTATPVAKPKKKLFGNLFKKKNKVEATDPKKKTDPAKKEEDDGF